MKRMRRQLFAAGLALQSFGLFVMGGHGVEGAPAALRPQYRQRVDPPIDVAARLSRADVQPLLELEAAGKFQEMEKAARNLLARVTADYGPESIQVAQAIDILLIALWRLERASAPETAGFIERALAIKNRLLRADDPDLVYTLDSAGVVAHMNGDYERARSLLERGLAIRESAFGPVHMLVGKSLSYLATVVIAMGEHKMALALDERAAAIQEALLTPDDPLLGITLMNLASSYSDAGDYERARARFEQALAIHQKSGDSLEVGITLGAYGQMQSNLGDYSAARTMLERAVALQEKHLGSSHPYLAETIRNLGYVMMYLGDYRDALRHAERAVSMQETAQGPDHPELAWTLQRLGVIQMEMGDLRNAAATFARAVAITERAVGTDHFSLGNHLAYLSDALGRAGSISEATAVAERAVRILEETLGSDHKDVAKALMELAHLQSTARPSDALRNALRAERISFHGVEATSAVLTERAGLAAAASRPSGLGLATDLALTHRTSPADVTAIWEAVGRARALVLEAVASRQAVAVRTESPEVAELFREMTDARQVLAELTLSGPGKSAAEYKVSLDRARERKEQTEQAVAAMSATFRVAHARHQTGLKEIGAALPPSSALIAFIRYRTPADFVSSKPGAYAAFVLEPGEVPRLVPIGEARVVENLVARWREQIRQQAAATGLGATALERQYRTTAELLRRRIWDPVVRHLRRIDRVFIVPDGALHLVDFSALPAPTGGYLVEAGPILHYLSAERDLVASPQAASASGLLAVGAPAFDDRGVFGSVAAGETSATTRPGARSAVPATFRGRRSACGELDALRFDALPASGREIRNIAGIWQRGTHAAPASVVQLLGAAANETNFKRNAAGKRVLHLATHGFFAGDECPSAGETVRTAPRAMTDAATGENPLLLSGLALAGANRRKEAGPDNEDGVLSAEEITTLDLRDVEWAVLSACDTGIGQIRESEGVFGLRRAFQIAGVRTVIMSLWQVEDESTRLWMRALYQRRFIAGRSTADAVRDASLQLLRSRRAKKQSTHPFYWAGFVATGDWR